VWQVGTSKGFTACWAALGWIGLLSQFRFKLRVFCISLTEIQFGFFSSGFSVSILVFFLFWCSIFGFYAQADRVQISVLATIVHV
jgi:hypothetical protein